MMNSCPECGSPINADQTYCDDCLEGQYYDDYNEDWDDADVLVPCPGCSRMIPKYFDRCDDCYSYEPDNDSDFADTLPSDEFWTGDDWDCDD